MSEQPDLIAPSQVRVTCPKILRAIARMEGMGMAKGAIKELKSPLPGLKFALSAIECEIHECKTRLFAQLTREAAKAGVNMALHAVVGVESKDGVEYLIALQSFDEMEAGE